MELEKLRVTRAYAKKYYTHDNFFVVCNGKKYDIPESKNFDSGIKELKKTSNSRFYYYYKIGS